ncbi:hypothetical protein [Cognatilysobacter bugurensis]|uniref:YbjN domain-containing protein n=1 Tax=Cognatilysobacter bugurensis TaxID=543356 RepID=A0A918T225_9GAMM|nr:hypothetical protein [Lysobacter bugurensis]GHA83207.1 hypothetical protein GCM10007067_21650 [Lysobacter bugurensis]
MRPTTVAALLFCLAGAVVPPAHADASIETRLKARGLQYEADEDGDYKLVYRYEKEGRTQLVFVSGSTEKVGGFIVREVFSPAARADRDGIDGGKALTLLADNRSNKLGAWELHGDTLVFVIKLPDNVDAMQLESALDIAAQSADEMEKELSGTTDAF